MEPPAEIDSELIRDEQVKVLKAIAPLGSDRVVRRQFAGHRQEKRVAPDSASHAGGIPSPVTRRG